MTESECPKARAMIALHQTARKIELKILALYKEHHVTPAQYGVLEVLYYKGQLSIAELIKLMMATNGNMTVVIKNLVQRGWVDRTCDPHDKRSSLVELTIAGQEFIEQVLPQHTAFVQELFSNLSMSELEQLTKLLQKIN